MKKNFIVMIGAIFIFVIVLGACTRSASGGPSAVNGGEEALPNPVSTQSQLMKDIIAGTQTAMAVPVDATPAEGEEAPAADDDDEVTTAATAQPKQVEATPIPLPTSTAGPPPVVELEYNTNYCQTSDCAIVSGQLICACVLDHTKDKSVKVQVSNAFFPRGTEIKFLMAPLNEYDLSKYVVAGVAEYKPSDGKNFFSAVLTIPDSLRGTASIVVRTNTQNSDVFASCYFDNK